MTLFLLTKAFCQKAIFKGLDTFFFKYQDRFHILANHFVQSVA
jgi:hypothetical protein